MFDSIIGYESTEAVNNPNFTRSWGHTFEPSTHTGILGTYRINNMFTLSAGVANTMDPLVNNRAFNADPGASVKASDKTYMGAISVSAPDALGFAVAWVQALTVGAVNGFNVNVVGVGPSRRPDQPLCRPDGF